MTLRIDQVRVKLSKCKDSVFLTDHPYYQSLLQNNKSVFENWMKTQPSHQRRKKSATWEGINELKASLAKGFDSTKSAISMKNGDMCRHGRHRLCLLAVLYPKAELVMDGNRVKSVIPKS
jgi:hypothetical protein